MNLSDQNKFDITTPLLALINTCEDLKVMTDFNAEICLPELNSKLLRIKTNTILNARTHSQGEIDHFNHLVFDRSPAIREGINSKKLKVKSVFEVIRKANKFKDWLDKMPTDANLTKEYVAKISEKKFLKNYHQNPSGFIYVVALVQFLHQSLMLWDY